MSATDCSPVLDEAVQMSFGEMAFIDAVPLKDLEEEVDTHQILFLDFQEPARGWIALFLPLALKKQISENIYAKDWGELNSEEIDDCLLELLNVLGGNFLSLYAGGDTRHNLSFPQVLFDEGEVPEDDSILSSSFDGEGIPFIIKMHIEGKKVVSS